MRPRGDAADDAADSAGRLRYIEERIAVLEDREGGECPPAAARIPLYGFYPKFSLEVTNSVLQDRASVMVMGNYFASVQGAVKCVAAPDQKPSEAGIPGPFVVFADRGSEHQTPADHFSLPASGSARIEVRRFGDPNTYLGVVKLRATDKFQVCLVGLVPAVDDVLSFSGTYFTQ